MNWCFWGWQSAACVWKNHPHDRPLSWPIFHHQEWLHHAISSDLACHVRSRQFTHTHGCVHAVTDTDRHWHGTNVMFCTQYSVSLTGTIDTWKKRKTTKKEIYTRFSHQSTKLYETKWEHFLNFFYTVVISASNNKLGKCIWTWLPRPCRGDVQLQVTTARETRLRCLSWSQLIKHDHKHVTAGRQLGETKKGFLWRRARLYQTPAGMQGMGGGQLGAVSGLLPD